MNKDYLTYLAESCNDDWGRMLTCPVCNWEYVHFETPVLKSNGDYKSWAGRGEAIEIPCWCENNHHWTIRLGFHKGFTFVKVENVQELESPNENDKKESMAIAFYHAGYEAAKSGKEFDYHKAIEMVLNLNELEKGNFPF